MDHAEKIYEEARRAGIDLNQLDSNLALTYEERVLRHESALELKAALKEAGTAYANSSSVAPAVS